MNRIRKLCVALAVMMAVLTMIPTHTTYAAAKGKAKTVTITLDDSNPYEHYIFSLAKASKIDVSVKIVSMKGKITSKKIDTWIYYEYDSTKGAAKGSFFYKLNKNKVKKGNVLKTKSLNDFAAIKEGHIDFWRPEGIKSIKLKVTMKPQKKGAKFSKLEKYNLTDNGGTSSGGSGSTSSGGATGTSEGGTNSTGTGTNAYASKIIFNANGGTGSMSEINTSSINGTTPFPRNAFTRSGYTFVRWATQPNGGGRYYYEWNNLWDVVWQNPGMTSITLYPVWVRFYSDYPGSSEFVRSEWTDSYSNGGCVAASYASASSTVLGVDITPKQMMEASGGSEYISSPNSVVTYFSNRGYQLGKLTVPDTKASLDECLDRYLSEPYKYAPPVVGCTNAGHHVVVVGRYPDLNVYMCIDSSGYTPAGAGGLARFAYNPNVVGQMNTASGGMTGNVDAVVQYTNTAY